LKKLDRLIQEAKESCKFREHTMLRFTHWDKDLATSNCIRCQMSVAVMTKPAANQIDISGQAVALNCTNPLTKDETPQKLLTKIKVLTEKGMILLPPSPDSCQVCAQKHEPDQPHNALSLYYQMKFHQANNRWPTWEDAMSHCTEEVKKAWREELTKAGEKLG
jgi:hypothetical protein